MSRALTSALVSTSALTESPLSGLWRGVRPFCQGRHMVGLRRRLETVPPVSRCSSAKQRLPNPSTHPPSWHCRAYPGGPAADHGASAPWSEASWRECRRALAGLGQVSNPPHIPFDVFLQGIHCDQDWSYSHDTPSGSVCQSGAGMHLFLGVLTATTLRAAAPGQRPPAGSWDAPVPNTLNSCTNALAPASEPLADPGCSADLKQAPCWMSRYHHPCQHPW